LKQQYVKDHANARVIVPDTGSHDAICIEDHPKGHFTKEIGMSGIAEET
jgi:hypothetical protein